MIVVKIELWPLGFEDKAKEIGRMTITNDLTTLERTSGNKSSYNVRVMRRGTIDQVQREGRVENYPRHSYTVWELVRRALNDVYKK